MVLNRFLVFLFLSLFAPHFVWGFSFERTANYKKIALEKRLAENPQWLKLGHYHPSWMGHPASKIRGSFFLSPTGANDPESELLTTIDQLLSEQNKNLQCRYLARMHWLKSVLPLATEDVLPCAERDEWKKKLGAKEVSLIFASSDINSPASSFGHTFLKFHNPENTQQLELLDYGVNYAAVTGTDGGALFALKGLFGFYPGNYSLLPYHQKMREYTNLEGRDLWEYKLKFSESDVTFLMDHLIELDGSYSNYYFTDENCSYQILEALNVLRPNEDLTKSFHDIVIPLDTVRVLNDLDLLNNETTRPSLQAEWRARYASLGMRQKKQLHEAVQNPQEFQWQEEISKKEKAEVLEAAMSYVAIKEYREQKEYKNEKYLFSAARAKLGPITDPLLTPPPESPLKSLRAQGFYLGFGQYSEQNYLSVKYRRNFHDLLSDDTGLSPFIHLEVAGFEFRYFTENKNFDLSQFTLLKILSTTPVNILDYPLSWTVDIGSQPKLAPYFDFGIGMSKDLTQKHPTRLVLLARSENRTEDSKYAGYAGAEALVITKWNRHFRLLLGAKYLFSFSDQEYFWDRQAGISISQGAHELRLEYKNRREVADAQASYIYFF